MAAADRDSLAALRFDMADFKEGDAGDMRLNELGIARLSDWLAVRDRRVAAQTLRDAADDFVARLGPLGLPWAADLRARADTTEGTHHD